MRSRQVKLSLLESPLFLASLALLAINDIFLKPIEINWLTGKLSDFAGLSALLLTLIALWPERAKSLSWLTAIGWVIWKTPLSRPIIDAIEWLTGVGYIRVEDPTDLLALLVLPIAYRYGLKHTDRSAFTLERGLALLTALVVFAGSPPQRDRGVLYEYRIDYIYNEKLFELLDKIEAAQPTASMRGGPGIIEVTMSERIDSLNTSTMTATFEIGQADDHTRLRLLNARGMLLGQSHDADPLPFIERHLISKLPPYREKNERLFYTDKHSAPGGPILILILSVLPLTLALRRRVLVMERHREGKKPVFSSLFGLIFFVIAAWMIITSVYNLIDAIHIGGPYIKPL